MKPQFFAHIKSAFFIGATLLSLSADGYAVNENPLADKLKARLVEEGFENVAVLVQDQQVLITYENRIYRHEVRAVEEILKIALPLAKEATSMTLILQFRKMPLLAITVPIDREIATSNGHNENRTFISTTEVSFNVTPFWRSLQDISKANVSLGKLDFVIHPQFIAQFGDYNDPWKAQINLAPELAVSLWPGMSLSAQLIIPLHNGLEEEGDYWRPGLLVFNQLLRFPQQTFASITLGYFTQQRYGADMEVKKYLLNGKFSLGANAGYTGYASYFKGNWTYSSLDFWTAFVNADYRLRRFDLTLRAAYGQFLYQDRGWRWDVLRQFREVDIGFYGIKTQTGTNLGFNFSVPISPLKHSKAGVIRARPANYFSWEYRYWGIWRSGSSGYRYGTGNDLDDFMKRLNPDYVKNRMLHQE